MDRTFLNIGYLDAYFCAPAGSLARHALFTMYALWLVFLFSTLGISASDLFCPNLATIVRLLGLDDNVAGVTLLAFGNGSPDMFATFSAMRAGSGGLTVQKMRQNESSSQHLKNRALFRYAERVYNCVN